MSSCCGVCICLPWSVQTLAAEAVELEEARRAVRQRELRATSAAEAASEEAASATAKLTRLVSERDNLAAAVGSLQVQKQRFAFASCIRFLRHRCFCVQFVLFGSSARCCSSAVVQAPKIGYCQLMYCARASHFSSFPFVCILKAFRKGQNLYPEMPYEFKGTRQARKRM